MPDVDPNWPTLVGWHFAPRRETASRTLVPEDSCSTSVCQGSPTFTINPGTLAEGVMHVFVDQCTFAGAVTIQDKQAATVSAWIPRASAAGSPFFRLPPGGFETWALPGVLSAPSIGCILAQGAGVDTFVLTSF